MPRSLAPLVYELPGNRRRPPHRSGSVVTRSAIEALRPGPRSFRAPDRSAPVRESRSADLASFHFPRNHGCEDHVLGWKHAGDFPDMAATGRSVSNRVAPGKTPGGARVRPVPSYIGSVVLMRWLDAVATPEWRSAALAGKAALDFPSDAVYARL